MGLFDFLRRKNTAAEVKPVSEKTEDIIVGAKEDELEQFQSFNNSNITFRGNLKGFDYDNILRDKQGNIIQ